MAIKVWFDDPTILFNKDYIFELWPTDSMCYEQKMNAITRLIILFTIYYYYYYYYFKASSSNVNNIGR